MLARIPVYSDENNLHHVSIFIEEPDGTFKRTQAEPLRMLRDNIDGISNPQGDVISPKFDKNERSWNSPTVSFHYGRPQSIYQFLRQKISVNKFYVFTKPNLSGRIIQFTLHELRLKPGTSQKILKLLKDKYVEAVDLWSKEQYRAHTNSLVKPAGVGSKARNQRLLDRKKRALRELKESHKRVEDVQQRTQTFIRYDNLSIDPDDTLLSNAGPGHTKANNNKFNSKKNPQKATTLDDSDSHFVQRFMILLD